MDNEVWKPVILNNQKTQYVVSNIGRVMNNDTGKILKQGYDKDGYLKVHICGKNCMVHRLVLTAFVPNPENYPQVNHRDGHKDNNVIENLHWCTGSQNVKHAIRTGLRHGLKGESNPANKYSENDIIEICELLQTGKYSSQEVSDITGAPRGQVEHIRKKDRWSHLTSHYDFSNVPGKDKYAKLWNSIDRAILAGKDRKDIVNAIQEHCLDKEKARALYKHRRKRVKDGKSIVQCTVYIDEGIEII